MHLRVQMSPVMFKEIFQHSLKISKFTRSCMENHSSVTGWQKLFSHTNSSNAMQSLLLRYAAETLQVT